MSAEAKPESAAPSSGGGGSKLVMILTLVNLIVCVGMGAVLFISFKKEKDKPQITDIQAGAEHAEQAGADGEKKAENAAAVAKKPIVESGKMMQLEMFTVNLSSPGGAAQKFVRVNISLEVPGDEVESEVTSKMPQVRNAIIDLFNSKRANDLATAEGRDFLKEEIRSALNSFMTTGKVKGVYFTNFAVTS